MAFDRGAWVTHSILARVCIGFGVWKVHDATANSPPLISRVIRIPKYEFHNHYIKSMTIQPRMFRFCGIILREPHAFGKIPRLPTLHTT